MKTKRIFSGLLGWLVVASCSNDELIHVNRDGDEVTFNVVTNAVTRAKEVYCNNNKPDAFKVWAKYDGKKYIDGDDIEYNKDASRWENTSGIRYWPGEEEVTFYAHYNAGALTWTGDDSNHPTVDFTAIGYIDDGNNNVSNQVDFIYAKKTQSSPVDGQEVSLNFHHALSQIVFKAKNTNENLYVEISKVTICNVMSQGTFTYPTGENTDNKIGVHNGDETISSYGTNWGTWGNTPSDPVDYAVDIDPKKEGMLPGGSDEAQPLTDTPKKTSEETTEGTSEEDEEDEKEFNNKAMLLLPQTSTAWDGSQKPTKKSGTYFLVTCRIFNVAGDEVVLDEDENEDKDKDVCLWGEEDKETGKYTPKDIAIPVALDWDQGKKYIYTFVFGDGNGGYDPEPDTPTPVLLPITFNVTVDDFVNGNGEGQNVPMDTN